MMIQNYEKNKKYSSLHKFVAYQSRLRSYEFYAAGDLQNFIVLASKASRHTYLAENIDTVLDLKIPLWRVTKSEPKVKEKEIFSDESNVPTLMI